MAYDTRSQDIKKLEGVIATANLEQAQWNDKVARLFEQQGLQQLSSDTRLLTLEELISEEVLNAEKLKLASYYLDDMALYWHPNFMHSNSDKVVTWNEYVEAICERFGGHKDPLEELKDLKQEGELEVYIKDFDILWNRVEIDERYALIFFLVEDEEENEDSAVEFVREMEELEGTEPHISMNALEGVPGCYTLKATLGDIVCNYKSMWMSFCWQEQRVTLKGNEPVKLQSVQYGKMSGLLDSNSGIAGVSLCSLSLVHETEGAKALLMGQNVNKEEKEVLQNLLNLYQNIFTPLTGLPPNRPNDHTIPLKEGAPPVNLRLYSPT
uniref:Retrotransposon gag domain-containing protein n=1 Tax=Populus alba TaxID=43335 RepID=A0A4V6A9D9_POPAL|nr:hypothetical protein D5086_0000120230 [Populus alba]